MGPGIPEGNKVVECKWPYVFVDSSSKVPRAKRVRTSIGYGFFVGLGFAAPVPGNPDAAFFNSSFSFFFNKSS